MISDKELLKQMLARDATNLYRQIPYILGGTSQVGPYLSLFEGKILSYVEIAADYAANLLFGDDSDIDEAADIAKMMANDKIEEYRKRVKESRNK